jgi:UDP-N-acetyl-2-amino-2-deoxyglucuronate dehydrogenase
MLIWVFGPVKEVKVCESEPDHTSGFILLEKARVNWFLSINYDHIPDDVKLKGKRTFRTLTIEGEEIEFSEGFTDLHNKSYEEILKGNGFGLDDARRSIELAHRIRVSNK